jgi:small subunit ribosomal protein S18
MEKRESRERQQPKKVDYGAINLVRIDYKDVSILRKFTDPYGRIISRRKTNVSAAHQRKVGDAIKRARFMGFLPYVAR